MLAVILASNLAWPAVCVHEDLTPFGPALDALWGQAIRLADTTADRVPRPATRPRFCFAPAPLWEGPTRILGGFDRSSGAAAILLTPEEMPRVGRCVIVHEMLHALLGPGREGSVRTLAACPEAERLGIDDQPAGAPKPVL